MKKQKEGIICGNPSEKVEVIQIKDREECIVANGFLICRCGECKQEDYK